MKRNFLSIAVLTVVLSVSSCKSSSSSFEADVKKMADYLCKEQQLRAKDPSDEKAKKDLEKVEAEMKAYSDKMEEKYKDKKGDKEMDAKAEKIMTDVMTKCK